MIRLNRSDIPSNLSLIAFESAARHASFTRAAQELHLTQSAISHQIKQLEDLLGFPLFERVRKRVLLTDAGRDYLAEVTVGLRQIAESTSRALASGGAQILNLAVLPSFGSKWLMPRLPGFLEAYPSVGINFVSRNAPFDFKAERLDAAIHYGEDVWPGCMLVPIFREDAMPLASPAYCERLSLVAPVDLTRARLLQQYTRPTVWSDWFRSLDIPFDEAFRGPRFDNFNMAAEAARAGMGVALLPPRLFREEITRGELRVICPHALPSLRGYFLVYPETSRASPLIAAFSRWIEEQSAL